MMNWLIYQIPWEWKLGFWLLLAAAVGIFVLRLFGVRWGIIVTAGLGLVAGAATLFNRGQQEGYQRRKDEAARAQDAALKDYEEIHNEAAAKPDADLDRGNAEFVRKDPKG